MKKRLSLSYIYYALSVMISWFFTSYCQLNNLQIILLNYIFTFLTIIPICLWNKKILNKSFFCFNFLIGLNSLVVLWIFFTDFAPLQDGLALFIIALINIAFAEEIIFRGIYYSSFLKFYSSIKATLFTSLLFTGIHIPKLLAQHEDLRIALIWIFFASLLLCLIFYLSHNLLLTTTIHFFINYFQFTNIFVLIFILNLVYLFIKHNVLLRKEKS
ncbi:hypothetical protein C815_00728 [Firmicutes bacterium M10-2]|nr:hypothetical protein C815_00728 [Firmicutes bacterium M10-2]